MLGLSRTLLANFNRNVGGLSGRLITHGGWKSTATLMLVAVLTTLNACYYPAHLINCPHNWFHTVGVLDNYAASLEKLTSVPVYYEQLRTPFIKRWTDQTPYTALTDFTPDTSFYLQRLSGRPLGRLLMYWHQDHGVMEVLAYPRDVLSDDLRLLADSADAWNPVSAPTIMMRCRPSWNPTTNRATLTFVNRRLLQYLQPVIGRASATTVIDDVDRHLAYHNTHLLQFPIDRLKLLAGILLALQVALFQLIAARTSAAKAATLYERYRGDVYGAKRLHWWQLFLSWNHANQLQRYTAALDQTRRDFRLRRQQEERKPFLEKLRFDLATIRLPQLELRLGEQTLPKRLKHYWDVANNHQADVEERLKSIHLLESWLRSQRHEVEPQSTPDIDPRPALLSRLADAKRRTLSPKQRQRLLECLEEYERVSGDQRQHLGNYWLEQAIRTTIEAEAEEPTAEPAAEPTETDQTSNNEVELRNLEDVPDLLTFDDLLPGDVDHDHARAIIIWGCLHPGQRGRTMVKARYITIQWVKEGVRNKLRQQFHPDAYDRAMQYLIRAGVLMTNHKSKRHQPIIALNPHANQANGEGAEIIRRVLKAKDVLTQLTSS